MAPNKSFLKSGMECIVPLFNAEVLVEFIGDLNGLENSGQKNLTIQNTFPEVLFINKTKATARKLAVIIWNMITKEQPFKKMAVQLNSEKYKATQLRHIEKCIGMLRLNQEDLKKLFSRTSLITT